MNVCNICGEYLTRGIHGIPEGELANRPVGDCPKCGMPAAVGCKLGHGDFSCQCQRGHRWSTTSRPG